MRRLVNLVILSPVSLAMSCGLLIGEKFDGYTDSASVPDTGPPNDGAVEAGSDASFDGGTDAQTDTGPDADADAQTDSGADTGPAVVPAARVVQVGLEGGCPGTLQSSYRFHTSVEKWNLYSVQEAPGQMIAHTADAGSPEPGAIRLQTNLVTPTQEVRIARFVPPSNVSCISARIYVPRGSISSDLARYPGFWLFFVQDESCYQQSGRAPHDPNQRYELFEHDVWYEASYKVEDFASPQEGGCVLDRAGIRIIGIGVGSNHAEPEKISGPVYIDSVSVYGEQGS